MKTADDRFKKLKWLKIENDNFINYEKFYQETKCTVFILFDKDKKQIEVSTTDENVIPVINTELHISIHLKMIELGWLF